MIPHARLLPGSRVPVFTDDPGWHGKRLQEAFAARGYEAVFLSLKDCRLEVCEGQAGVYIPGFEALPECVFVRGVPGGTLQQVIVRLDILHALQMLGVKVYNNGRAIERTVDKAMTSFVMHTHRLPTPPTWVCESRHAAHAVIDRELALGHELVIKPLFGSQGQGVRKLTRDVPLPLPMDEHVDGLFYLQRFVESGEGRWHDYRVFVINGKAVGAMVRHGASWINNVAQGGRCEMLPHGGEMGELAEATSRALEMDYCGIDIIRDRKGQLYVLEVNSIPAWKGLQGVVGTDIAQLLVDDLLAKTISPQPQLYSIK